MQTYCEFHPFTPGKWHCEKCGTSFCSKCVSRSEQSPDQRFCPECSEPLQEVQVHHKEARLLPWNQTFHLFFNGSFRFWVAAFFAVALMVSFYAYEFSNYGSVAGYLMFAGALWLGLGLSKAIMLTYSDLKTLPALPEIMGQMKSTDVLSLWGQGIIVIGIVAGLSLFEFNNSALVTASLGILIGPLWVLRTLFASLSEGAQRRISSKKQVLKRLKSTEILGSMKERYVELIFLAYSGFLLTQLFASFLGVFASASVTQALASSASAAAGLLFFIALGLSARHLYLSATRTSRKKVVNYEPQSFEDSLSVALKTGRYNFVLDELEEAALQEHAGFRLEQFYRVLRYTENWNALERYSHKILDYLLVRSKVPECISFIHALKEKKPEFRIWDPSLCLHLAECFERRNAHSMILWLSIDAHKRFTDHPKVVSELYFMVAHVLEQQGQSDEKVAAFRRFAFKLKADAQKLGAYSSNSLNQANPSFTKPRIV